MGTVFVNAFGFLFMILLGFTLKRTGLFSVEDSGLLSKLVLKITLPMAIIHNFRSLELSPSFLVAIGLGFAVNFAAIGEIGRAHV